MPVATETHTPEATKSMRKERKCRKRSVYLCGKLHHGHTGNLLLDGTERVDLATKLRPAACMLHLVAKTQLP